MLRCVTYALRTLSRFNLQKNRFVSKKTLYAISNCSHTNALNYRYIHARKKICLLKSVSCFLLNFDKNGSSKTLTLIVPL